MNSVSDKMSQKPTALSPAWLESVRQESRRKYSQSPLPLRTSHLWRYSDPAMFVSDNEAVAAPPPAIPRLSAPPAPTSAQVTVYTGATTVVSIGDQARAANVTILSLADALSTCPDLVRKYLGTIVGAEFGKFEALNSAQWRNGVFIYAPRGVQLVAPISVTHIGAEDDGWTFGRTLIALDEGAEATIIEEYASASDTAPARSNSVVEVFAEPRSKVSYVTVNRQNSHSTAYYTHRLKLSDHTTATTMAVSVGGKTLKADMGALLVGERAESRQYGLVFGSENQRFDHHTVHLHSGAHGYSNLDFKVALKDNSRSAYTGLIRVNVDTPHCEAYQSNRNLLLNPGARAESIPELEILCDEVICTHGATVGQIDPMEIFYLMSRGVDAQTATRMIVRGHVEPTLALLPSGVRERVTELVESRIAAL